MSDYQKLVEQWNKDLEGIDFSLEPFLKKCKQEQEERQKQRENTQQYLLLRGDSALFTINQPIQTINYRYSLLTTSCTSNTSNMQAQNVTEIVTTPFVENNLQVSNRLNKSRQQPKGRKKTKNCNNQPSNQEKSLIIHVEHPELPKEKKKRGRPCKRNYEERNCSGDNKTYIFVSDFL